MPPTLDAATTALQKELLLFEQGIPELLELDDHFWAKIETQKWDPTSNRPARLILLDKIQGTFQQADMDAGDLGGNSGPAWIVATVQPLYFVSGYSISAKAAYGTQGAERGVQNVVRETFRLAMEQFRSVLDMACETAGNGVMGTITSVAAAVFTLTTDGFKEELFYVGMPVQVFNAAGTVDRGSTTITAIDRDAHKVTVAAAPAGTVATDLLVIEGLAAPITIQSSLFGKQYHQSDASTGLWMNVDRATQINVRTPSVNAASSALNLTFIRQAKRKILLYIGKKQIKDAKLIASGHPAQGDAYEALATQISNIWKEPSGNQKVDLLFDVENGLTMSGVPYDESIHADRTRVDFMALKYWQRIVATDTGYYRKVGSDEFIFQDYVANGAEIHLQASSFFKLKTGLQLVNRHPLAGSYIKSLSLPAGIY